MRFFIPVVIFLSVSVFLWKGLDLKPEVLPSTFIGQKAPTFKANNKTEAIFKGKVTLLNVWATWCASCQSEHAFWLKLAQPADLQLISLNYHDDEEEAKAWLLKHGDPYATTLFDTKGQICIDYGISGVPTTFVIDKKGIVRYRHMGIVDKNVWDNTLLPLIEKLQ
jgi:cytochrome c biogenesis protein CcmG/thiol:disulfide interchange protein DsbE